MLNILALVIIHFFVSFLETGVALDEYSERILYVQEADDTEEIEITLESETPVVEQATPVKQVPPKKQENPNFEMAITGNEDAEELLERIYMVTKSEKEKEER